MGLDAMTRRMLVVAGAAALGTIAIDQSTKAIARSTMQPGETHDLALDGRIGTGHVQNHGSAYGLISAMPTWVPALGTAAVGGAMLALNRGSKHPLLVGVGVGLVIGGGAGNVIDRIHQGHVTDFIHTTDAFGYYNVADAALNVGLAASIGAVLLQAR